jgi:hypothetical protein
MTIKDVSDKDLMSICREAKKNQSLYVEITGRPEPCMVSDLMDELKGGLFARVDAL